MIRISKAREFKSIEARIQENDMRDGVPAEQKETVMSVIGGILLYAAGIATGAGMLMLHHWDVRRSVNAVRSQKNAEIAKWKSAYERLQEDAGIMQQASDCADAFRRGKTVGRADPMTGAERFARTFEGRNVRFVDTSKKEG